ncbi:DUF6916 family protein [Leifsonia poae]|uniref:DUF6916 family protein n=1 Tax=Leifsonia poae TaxID=110933 RepID=UPI001CBD97BA|nr:hypothetical protein [Leifsonia poae]
MNAPSHTDRLAAVGTDYRAIDESGAPHSLRLDGCSPLVASGGWASYSLRYLAEPGTASDQGTYLLTPVEAQPEAEPEAIFLVPIAQRSDGIEFEAVFTFPSEETE